MFLVSGKLVYSKHSVYNYKNLTPRTLFPGFVAVQLIFLKPLVVKISSCVRFQKNESNKQIDRIYSLKSRFFYGIFVFSYLIQYKNFGVHLPEVDACVV